MSPAWSGAQADGYREGMDVPDERTRLAIVNVARSLSYHGLKCEPTSTGRFGPSMTTACKTFQAATGLKDDGAFGPVTAKACYSPWCDEFDRENGLRTGTMRGLVGGESAWDPGAYNVNDDKYRSVDRGLVMSNDIHQPDITDLQAYGRSRYILNYAAGQIRSSFDGLKAQFPFLPEATAWDLAVFNHNWPAAVSSEARYLNNFFRNAG